MGNVNYKLQSIIEMYNFSVMGIENVAKEDTNRAYGGIIRSSKGELVESISRQLVDIAWSDFLQQDPKRIKFDKKKIPIGINDEYISRINDEVLRTYVIENKSLLVYKFGTDVQVYVDGKICLPIECKAYTENAMLKRILFDAALMKEGASIRTYYLVQLESQLGGDYSMLNNTTYGSPSTHALLSHVDVDLKIITLLKGERKVDKPIHKSEFFKELEIENLYKAVNLFADDLKIYVK